MSKKMTTKKAEWMSNYCSNKSTLNLDNLVSNIASGHAGLWDIDYCFDGEPQNWFFRVDFESCGTCVALAFYGEEGEYCCVGDDDIAALREVKAYNSITDEAYARTIIDDCKTLDEFERMMEHNHLDGSTADELVWAATQYRVSIGRAIRCMRKWVRPDAKTLAGLQKIRANFNAKH